MSKREYLQRHLLIIRRLQKGVATFEEIRSYLKNQLEISGGIFDIKLRTFQRDREEILSLYSILIEYDFKRKVYYIADQAQADFNLQLLAKFELFNALIINEDLSRHIHFQYGSPTGAEYFNILLNAVRSKNVIHLTYEKFDDEPAEYAVEPYALKEFEGRWYLVAHNSTGGYFTIFGLDRIKQIEVSAKKFKSQSKWTIGEYFRDCFGIIHPPDSEPQKIVLSFNPEQGKYIKSLPLHKLQNVTIDNDKELRVELFIHPTFDFIQKLLSYADDVKVISPASLRKEICKRYGNALKQYK